MFKNDRSHKVIRFNPPLSSCPYMLIQVVRGSNNYFKYLKKTRLKSLSICRRDLQSHQDTDTRAWKRSEAVVVHTGRANSSLKTQITYTETLWVPTRPYWYIPYKVSMEHCGLEYNTFKLGLIHTIQLLPTGM